MRRWVVSEKTGDTVIPDTFSAPSPRGHCEWNFEISPKKSAENVIFRFFRDTYSMEGMVNAAPPLPPSMPCAAASVPCAAIAVPCAVPPNLSLRPSRPTPDPAREGGEAATAEGGGGGRNENGRCVFSEIIWRFGINVVNLWQK